MRFPVDLDRGLGARRFDQAEDFAAGAVEPVLQLSHPVLVLNSQVLLVPIAHHLSGQIRANGMDV